MAVFGKFQMYHGKIRTILDEIKTDNEYLNISKAFAHWYLECELGIDEQEIAEAIIDGNGDNGVDAILVENNCMFLYQFKFPDKEKNIDKSIDEKTVLKMFNGYKKLVSNRKLRIANENFLKYKEIIQDEVIYNYKFVFVVFNDTFSEPAKDVLDTEIEEILVKTGNQISIKTLIHKNICDLYDRMQKKERLDLSLIYKKFDTGYNTSEVVKSFVGFANAKDIIEACKDNMDVIFDENIRLYEGDNDINNGIYNTAIGIDSMNFFFYHNGIVLICDNCKNSTGNQQLLLEGASVVNGCQTINSLKRAYDDGFLKEDVFVQFRIIETSDFDLRAKITEFLNSQTKIKDSYFLANDTFIRALQSELMVKGYFLQRLFNEYSYKRSLGKINEYDKKYVLELEKVIQIFAAFYHNEYAARAKRGKGELFDKKVVENIVSSINPDKVIHSMEWYNKISRVITKYRKGKRSDNLNREFFEFMDMDVSNSDYSDVMGKYSFLNTGDILVLNVVSNLERKKGESKDDENYIIEAINLCCNTMKESQLAPYQFTKNNTIFELIQKNIIES